MDNSWTRTSLGDICRFRAGTAFPKQFQGEDTGEIPFIKVSDLKHSANSLYIRHSANWVDMSTVEHLKASLLHPGAIVFAKIGEGLKAERFRLVARATCIDNNLMGAIPQGVNAHFLYYFMIHTGVAHLVEGSALPYLRQSDLERIPVCVPPNDEQQRIAGVLGALDDKIESNRQICSLINLLSEELFCSRFRLRKDCTTKGILTIGDLGEIVGGGTPSKKVEEYYVDSGIAWLTPKDLARDSSTFRHHGAIDISELGLRKSSARLLPRGTVLFTSRAPIGYIAIASGETSTNQGFKSIVPHPEFGTAFTFYLLKQLTPEIVSSANGSTFKEISKGGLASISFDAPDRASVREFNSLVQPLLDLQEAKESETCRLSKLRDALLPELMSGRMRVDEAGCLVSEALDEEVRSV